MSNLDRIIRSLKVDGVTEENLSSLLREATRKNIGIETMSLTALYSCLREVESTSRKIRAVIKNQERVLQDAVNGILRKEALAPEFTPNLLPEVSVTLRQTKVSGRPHLKVSFIPAGMFSRVYPENISQDIFYKLKKSNLRDVLGNFSHRFPIENAESTVMVTIRDLTEKMVLSMKREVWAIDKICADMCRRAIDDRIREAENTREWASEEAALYPEDTDYIDYLYTAEREIEQYSSASLRLEQDVNLVKERQSRYTYPNPNPEFNL